MTIELWIDQLQLEQMAFNIDNLESALEEPFENLVEYTTLPTLEGHVCNVVNSTRFSNGSFYADWCNPCKVQGKQLEQYQEEIPEVKVIKIDIEVDHEMAQEFGVRSIPTLVYMVDGEVIDKATGLKRVNELKQFTKTE